MATIEDKLDENLGTFDSLPKAWNLFGMVRIR